MIGDLSRGFQCCHANLGKRRSITTVCWMQEPMLLYFITSLSTCRLAATHCHLSWQEPVTSKTWRWEQSLQCSPCPDFHESSSESTCSFCWSCLSMRLGRARHGCVCNALPAICPAAAIQQHLQPTRSSMCPQGATSFKMPLRTLIQSPGAAAIHEIVSCLLLEFLQGIVLLDVGAPSA